MVASTESRARRLSVVRNFATAESFATRARRKRCWSFWSRLARALSARIRRSSATCRAARRTSPYPTSSSATPTTRSRLLTSNGALRSIDQYMGPNIAIDLRRIQNFTDFAGHGFGRKRLCEVGDALIEQPVLPHRAVGIARHEYHPESRPARTQGVGELASVRVGHDDVGEHQVDPSLMAPG